MRHLAILCLFAATTLLAPVGFGSAQDFSATGTVALVFEDSRTYLETPSGYLAFSCKDNNRLEPGDFLAIRGDQNAQGSPDLLVAKTVSVLGKRVPPMPMKLSLADTLSHTGKYSFVQIEGTVIDTFRDDIDTAYDLFIIHADGRAIVVSAFTNDRTPRQLESYKHATVSVTGILHQRLGDTRIYQGRGIFTTKSSIRILRPPPDNLFDVPLMKEDDFINPESIAGVPNRRGIVGTVLACRQGNQIMLQTAHKRISLVQLAEHVRLPDIGDVIKAVGYPETDLFSINLSDALWRKTGDAQIPHTAPLDLSADQLLFDNEGHPQIQPRYHGRLIRLSGTVRTLSPVSFGNEKIHVDSHGHDMQVDVSACPEGMEDLTIGTSAEFTGICLMDTDNWRPNRPIPRVRGVTLVLRSRSDVRILSRPSWWTPWKMSVIIGVLLVLLAASALWIRGLHRVIARSCRQLLEKELAQAGAELRVDERTRLAVELHDALSQTLTGVSFQIAAVKQACRKDPTQVEKFINIASRTLERCREELRNCLWDLRNRAIDASNAEEALRLTLAPYTDNAEVSVDFKVPRIKISDSTFHAILRIVRELVVNAIRHGEARHIDIHGERTNAGLAFTVRDDGKGFDIDNRPGLKEGHFGLHGISERLVKLNGAMTIASDRGNGTTVRIVLGRRTT